MFAAQHDIFGELLAREGGVGEPRYVKLTLRLDGGTLQDRGLHPVDKSDVGASGRTRL